MTKAAAIYQFWSGFDLTVYEENAVPDGAGFPYITYQLVTDSINNEVAMTASLWYHDTSWVGINAKAEEISAYIGRGGKVLKCDGGRIWVKRGQPFAQNMGDDTDDQIRRKYMNLTVEYLTAD